MTVRRVDQLLAGFADGDAISQEARLIHRIFRGMGLESEIYAPPRNISPTMTGQCRPADEFAAGYRDVTLFHYSTASSVTELFLQSPARKVVRYHNITPPEFFMGFDDAASLQLQEARYQLPAVLSGADKVCPVSGFNAEELEKTGCRDLSIVPLLFSFEEFEVPPEARMQVRLQGPLKNILFVGRMVPNKCVEELLLAFAWYHRTIRPDSRLILVGSEHSCPRYYAMLTLLAGRLGLTNVLFEKFVSDGGRTACYRAADLFVTASRHEGFCLPLIEAMCHGVPVIARAQGGMPEALGGSGVLFDETTPRVLAELMHRVLSDAPLRDEIRESQRQRITRLRRRDLCEDCRRFIS